MGDTFRELFTQVKRLFSSKNNGGKLVYRLTDRLHHYKQVLLATSILLLLGYSQFRSHFECQGVGKLDKNTLTTFCWINGTTTLDLRDQEITQRAANIQRQLKATTTTTTSTTSDSYISNQIMPHVGMHFRLHDGKYELINHNYMRSLWALLILMALCSFLAQRSWANIFNHDILKALLQLPGSEDLPLVRRAQAARAYDTLIKLPSGDEKKKNNNNSKSKSNKNRKQNGGAPRIQEEEEDELGKLFHTIDILTGEENEHNHTLDYYLNQLIYLLLAKRTSAYRLSDLKLKRKIINYSILSFVLTAMQFVLPWIFIGQKYKLYGWKFMLASLRYFIRQFMDPNSSALNSVDYDISSRIWPTSTQCEYKQYGFQGLESVTVQCTVSINEICGKLFVVIWWFVAINIVIELYSLLSILICSVNFDTTKWTFGRRFWPHSKKQTKLIATFRYRHAVLLRATAAAEQNQRTTTEALPFKQYPSKESNSRSSSSDNNNNYQLAASCEICVQTPTANSKSEKVESVLSAREKKKLEAKGDKISSSGSSISSKKWYLWCSRDVGLFLADQGKKLSNKPPLKAKNRTFKDEDGFREIKEDSNIYFLLYLLYFRLSCSQKKIEQIIRLTSSALGRYLESLSKLEELKEFVVGGEGNTDNNQVETTIGSVEESSAPEVASKQSDTIINVMMTTPTTVGEQ